MATETAKIVYLTDKDKTQKYLPKSIGSAVIHMPSNDYETATQTNVSAELDKLAKQLQGKSVADLLTALTNADGGLSLTVADVVKTIASLNAHTVDGYHAGTSNGQLIPIVASNFSSSSGYVKWGNGLIVQWGVISNHAEEGYAPQTVVFPISFTDAGTYLVTLGYDYYNNKIFAVTRTSGSSMYGHHGPDKVHADFIAIGY